MDVRIASRQWPSVQSVLKSEIEFALPFTGVLSIVLPLFRCHIGIVDVCLECLANTSLMGRVNTDLCRLAC